MALMGQTSREPAVWARIRTHRYEAREQNFETTPVLTDFEHNELKTPFTFTQTVGFVVNNRKKYLKSNTTILDGPKTSNFMFAKKEILLIRDSRDNKL